MLSDVECRCHDGGDVCAGGDAGAEDDVHKLGDGGQPAGDDKCFVKVFGELCPWRENG